MSRLIKEIGFIQDKVGSNDKKISFEFFYIFYGRRKLKN